LGNDLLKHIGCDPRQALDVLITKQNDSNQQMCHGDAIDAILPMFGNDEQLDIVQRIRSKVI